MLKDQQKKYVRWILLMVQFDLLPPQDLAERNARSLCASELRYINDHNVVTSCCYIRYVCVYRINLSCLARSEIGLSVENKITPVCGFGDFFFYSIFIKLSKGENLKARLSSIQDSDMHGAEYRLIDNQNSTRHHSFRFISA